MEISIEGDSVASAPGELEDRAGSVVTRRYRDWRAVIQDHELSGLSVPEYCREHSINRSSFYHNRNKLRGGAPSSKPLVGNGFIRVGQARGHVCKQSYEVELVSGIKVRIPSGFVGAEVRDLLLAVNKAGLGARDV